MKIKDKNVKKMVDVQCKECPTFQCYWPRLHPGTFRQGIGYKSRYYDRPETEWICGTREVHGCPVQPKKKEGT